LLAIGIAGSIGAKGAPQASGKSTKAASGVGKVVKSEKEWQASLTADQYRVLREKGTEMAFTGKYWNFHGDGVYRCAGCGLELFSSDTKFDSGTGWPSFTAPMPGDPVEKEVDRSHGMTRTEVHCRRCGGHLGHVFDDGPGPKGQRYCINSASLCSVPKK
jgi:peptide-methionine (R)-S-oxide reductase